MKTVLRRRRTIDSQQIAPFTGEGAYHGSTRAQARPQPPPPVVEETRPRTLEAYERSGQAHIDSFEASFPNQHEIVEQLPVPSPEAIAADAVTLCWCPLGLALRQAGPLTRRVLEAMAPHLSHSKRHCYVDSKIQYLRRGDLPVDSQLWHVDGSIVARGEQVERFGVSLLHDMRARLTGTVAPPRYLAYQSSHDCATQLATAPVTIELPELIGGFDVLDQRVRRADPQPRSQPAASIVRFDGRSLHRARVAERPGWRLWIRCVETDREVHLTSSIIECYNTVFRTAEQRR